jgi:hypothetical protein
LAEAQAEATGVTEDSRKKFLGRRGRIREANKRMRAKACRPAEGQRLEEVLKSKSKEENRKGGSLV